MDERDQSVIALDNPTIKRINGIKGKGASKVVLALSNNPKGLKIEDVCDICGIARGTLQNSFFPQLMELGVVESTRVTEGDRRRSIYRIKQPHRDLSIDHDFVKRRP